MTSIEPITLTGKYVILELLSQAHHDGLVEAVRDGELWKLWYTGVPAPEEMAAEIDRRLELQERGSMLPFTARLIDPASGGPGKVIGMTSYMNIDAATPRVEIGSTWNAVSAQGWSSGWLNRATVQSRLRRRSALRSTPRSLQRWGGSYQGWSGPQG